MLGEIAQLRKREYGLSMMARDVKVDLTRFATKVTLIHRRGELRASKIMAERALANEKIEFAWHSEVDEVLGSEFVTGVRLKDLRDGTTREIDIEALFIAIGHQPNTSLFKNQLDFDDADYLKVKPGTSLTSIEGIFACGDVADPVYRQAVTAAGTGCMDMPLRATAGRQLSATEQGHRGRNAKHCHGAQRALR